MPPNAKQVHHGIAWNGALQRVAGSRLPRLRGRPRWLATHGARCNDFTGDAVAKFKSRSAIGLIPSRRSRSITRSHDAELILFLFCSPLFETRWLLRRGLRPEKSGLPFNNLVVKLPQPAALFSTLGASVGRNFTQIGQRVSDSFFCFAQLARMNCSNSLARSPGRFGTTIAQSQTLYYCWCLDKRPGAKE